MPKAAMPAVAVIADAHFHDPTMPIPGRPTDPGLPLPAFRRLAETARSTRVFNESAMALDHALSDVLARGIRHVVLLGDYSDDGQAATMARLRGVLDLWRRRGLHFYAVPGNHDIFGPFGRHRSKRFLTAAGSYDLVTSDPDFGDEEARRTLRWPEMYCTGYPDGLRGLPNAGFFPDPSYLHWETPFGLGGAPEERRFAIRSPGGAEHWLMDGSYLVEPAPDLWLMMIDANVFVPLGGTPADGYADSTSAGWNAMLRHKPFVLDWMADVARRARAGGKRLVTFSHYPVLDPLCGTWRDEVALLGSGGMTDRIPRSDVAEAVAATGIGVHFSGHLHIEDLARGPGLTNVSVPSLVGFPPAYKILRFDGPVLQVETVGIGELALSGATTDQYRAEVAATGLKCSRFLEAGDYGAFLWEHLGHLAARRYLKREWPADLAEIFRNWTLTDVAELALGREQRRPGETSSELAQKASAEGIDTGAMTDTTALAFLEDWYRVRMGGGLALRRLPSERLAAERFVASLYAAAGIEGGLGGRLARVFAMFTAYVARPYADAWEIDPQSGDATAATVNGVEPSGCSARP